jgi:hypothetical protein
MLTLACRNGHVAAHRLIQVTRWFTLFLIPIIPFNQRHYSICAQCGVQVGWSKEDAERAVARGAATIASAPVDPVAPPLENGGISTTKHDSSRD